MMTEEMTASERSAKLCSCGSKSENPCWRGATHKRYEDDAEPSLCAEHARCYELMEVEEPLYRDLDHLEEWIKERSLSGETERLVTNMRDELRGHYAQAAERVRAADLVADQGPPASGEPRLTLEQSERLASLLIRSDSLNNALTFLEDLSEEDAPSDRWIITAALADVGADAHAEFERYRLELGFKDEPEHNTLSAVNGHPSEAIDLLDLSHPPNTEQAEEERRAHQAICEAGQIVARLSRLGVGGDSE